MFKERLAAATAGAAGAAGGGGCGVESAAGVPVVGSWCGNARRAKSGLLASNPGGSTAAPQLSSPPNLLSPTCPLA